MSERKRASGVEKDEECPRGKIMHRDTVRIYVISKKKSFLSVEITFIIINALNQITFLYY